MPESVKKDIGGVSYRIQELLATERDEFLFEMNDLFGAWLPNLIEHYFKDTVELKDIAASGFIQSILQRSQASPQAKTAFIKNIILASVKSPKSANVPEEYDVHWSKHYAHRPELLKEIFALNFGPMILELKKKLRQSGIFTPQFSEDLGELPELKTEPLSEKPKQSFPKPNFSNGR